MSQDLLEHPMFIDETDDLHQSTAMVAKKRAHFPDFFAGNKGFALICVKIIAKAVDQR